MTIAAVQNRAGRDIPSEIMGLRLTPFAGLGARPDLGHRAAPRLRSVADYPRDGNKVAPSLIEALKRAPLRDGMSISTHHHLRNGDRLAIQVFQILESLGLRDLVWYPSAVFPCHAELIPLLESGVIHHIEGSLNGPLGAFASAGKMAGPAVLRSHGGRYRAIQDGDISIDLAVIAAPTADPFGNAHGLDGPSACGSLGFALADSQYADHVIVATDNLVPFPCLPAQIQGNAVDQVVEVESLGDSSQIVSGTTQLTRSPDRLLISEMAACFVRDAGILQDGFSFQAGAGGISLAFTLYLRDLMRQTQTKARFIRGGSTKYLVEMLEDGLTDYILDGQTFDMDGIRSLRENPRHVATTPYTSYNFHGKGNFASMVDVAVLGATEVDLDFNANVVTHSDGVLAHGIGGWQDALFGKCTILAVPTFRNRLPIIRDRVTTLCGPGELIDAVVTERGIAINPRRGDLREAMKSSQLPLKSLEQLKDEAEAICGKPDPAEPSSQPVGWVTWVDGTVIDVVRKVPHEVIE